MERKIGEIFEYNGWWYQCVKSPEGSCKHCDMNFGGKCPIPIKECVASSRSDLSYVIFKKLEKVREPYECCKKLMQEYIVYAKPIIPDNFRHAYIRGGYDETISIEIKQTKEDMEEHNNNIEQTPLEKLIRDFFTNRISDMEFEMRVSELYEKHSNSENIGKNLKEFDFEAAKAGKPVCTRDERRVRIICWDKIGNFPIVALVMGKNNKEAVFYYNGNGRDNDTIEKDYDLMMLPEKKEGWVNVYRDCDGANITKDDNIYSSKEAAMASAQVIDRDNYVATTIIKWEE